MSLSSSRPHTPIRRISRGSIGASPGGTSGISASSLPPSLAHLDQALGLLGDETITLEANLAAWQSVEDSSESLRLRKELSISASAQPQTSSSTGTSTGPLRGSVGSGFLASNVQPSSSSNADTTYATADESAVADTSFPLPPSPAMVAKSGVPSVPSGSAKSASGSRVPPASGATKAAPAHTIKSALKKPAASTKPKLSPAERKAREAFVSSTIDRLPLEWRGSDPALTNVAQTTLRALIDAADSGSHLPDLVTQTKLPRVQVNKVLNALVLAKQVVKDQDAKGALYILSTLP